MTEPEIRVGIVDDQELVRRGFAALIDAEPDLRVVGQAGNGREAVDLAHQHPVDVMLMDIRMPEVDGLEAARLIKTDERVGDVRIIVLTTFDLDEYVYDALRAGAEGFLLKDTAPQRLLDAIRVVHAGDALIAPSVTRRLIAEFAARPDPQGADRLAALTDREVDVLRSVATGADNAAIADQLHMSPLTAKTHVSRILAKVGASNRAQLVAVAYETGLVVPGEPN